MAVRITSAVKATAREEQWLLRRARRHIRNLSLYPVPGAAALKKAELSVLLTSDKEIQKLNRQWRQKNKATDVLSFPQLEPNELKRMGVDSGPWELGDIVISLDRARAQAEEHGVTLLQELDLLLVHGLLHLLGLDHERSPGEEKKMRLLERKLTGKRGLL